MIRRLVCTVLVALVMVCRLMEAGLCAEPAGWSMEIADKPQMVFDTKTQACEPIDIPDESARAFRDDRGNVHLVSSHYVTRVNVGRDLDHLSHDCRVVYRSTFDPRPEAYSDYDWLASFYSMTGKDVIALVHNEYHGWKHPGMCLQPSQRDRPGHCWWNTIGFAISHDGGATFSMPAAPKNLIASTAAPYDKNNSDGANGLFQPSNIVFFQHSYYVLVDTWHNDASGQKSGACLLQTRTVSDPGSWRAWDGSRFAIRFYDPYRRRPAAVETGQCAPVYPGHVDSLVYHPGSGNFVITESATTRHNGSPSLHVALSKDLVHWGRRIEAIKKDKLASFDGPGRWSYGYFSLIDPTSTDDNFGTISDNTYLYYMRADDTHPPLTRTLMRIKMHLALSN